jgi:3-hydroxy-9,10-secoandrosta-1,3,5(10)-triene-9,17-dione monooxygenase
MEQKIIDQAIALGPIIKARARAGEINREVPEQTVVDFIESGILQIMIPEKYGGYQTGWDTLIEVLMELGRGDGSQAWVAAVYTVHALDISMFMAKAQKEVWNSNCDPIVSSAVAPMGIGERVRKGAVISGQWAFASGVRYAEWGILGVMLPDQTTGEKTHHLCLVSKNQWKVRDTWEVMGLQGTGSHDIIVQEIFIPEYRIITRDDQRNGTSPGTLTHYDKIYATPYLTIGPVALAAVPVGCALGALDEFIASAKTKEHRGIKIAEKESIQLRIAESSAEVDCARMLLQRIGKDTSEKMRKVGHLSTEERSKIRRDTAYACILSKRAVERLHEVTGAHGLYLDKHFQRYYRDIKAASNHIAVGWDRCGSTFGRVALGLEPGADEI